MVTVDGNEWELFIGMNGDMKVFSFVAPSSMNDFSSDAKQFYNHLESEQDFPVSSQNLIGKSIMKLLRLYCVPDGFVNMSSLPIWD